MRSINVSTEVFAWIWSQRKPGEETEDAILRRVFLGESTSFVPPPTAPVALGAIDRRSGVEFSDGFEIFRTYLGTEYRARASGGAWVLQNDGKSYGSLNELSRAIGARVENAWVNWFYPGPDGNRKPVSDLRDPSRISRRKIESGETRQSAERQSVPATSVANENPQADHTDATWRDDVHEALRGLNGRGSLDRIYRGVEQRRRLAGRSVPRTLEAIVRRTLEDHSSDSANYRGGPDLFFMPEGRGAGIWALRDRAEFGR
jgi:hypothetical protein